MFLSLIYAVNMRIIILNKLHALQCRSRFIPITNRGRETYPAVLCSQHRGQSCRSL